MNKSNRLSRRTLFAGVGTVGAAAVAVGLLPGLGHRGDTTLQPKQPPAKGGGYSLTEHVKQYYKTTSI